MFQVEVLDLCQPSARWRGVCISDEADEGLMFAFSDQCPARSDRLAEAIDLVDALHGDLGVRAGVRHLQSGRLIYDCAARQRTATSKLANKST